MKGRATLLDLMNGSLLRRAALKGSRPPLSPVMRPLPPKATPLKFTPSTKSLPPTPAPSRPTTSSTNATLSKTPTTATIRTVAQVSDTAPTLGNEQLQPENISSPHELTAFVENVLVDLEKKFDDMSTQILDRMSQMSSRIDSLELAIQELLNDDIGSNTGRTDSPTLALGRQA